MNKPLICLMVYLILFTMGCSREPKTAFAFVEAEKYQIPNIDDVKGILVYDSNDFTKANLKILIGDKRKIEKLIGKQLQPDKIIEGGWLPTILGHWEFSLEIAETNGFRRESNSDARVVFVTKNKGYVREFNVNIDDEYVYDKWMQSEFLFSLLGLAIGYTPTELIDEVITDELLASKTDLDCFYSKPKEELTKDSFSKLDLSKVEDVRIISPFLKKWPNTANYTHVFRISVPERINTTIGCMRNAKQIGYDIGRTRRLLVFETNQTIYFTFIDWDAESAYGDWWQSAELLKNFKQWGLFEELPKREPMPPPNWRKNPPRESDPNFPRLPPIKMKEE